MSNGIDSKMFLTDLALH